MKLEILNAAHPCKRILQQFVAGMDDRINQAVPYHQRSQERKRP